MALTLLAVLVCSFIGVLPPTKLYPLGDRACIDNIHEALDTLPWVCYELLYFYIFTSHHILSRLVLSTNCFIICFVTNHTPFHYQSRTHVRHMPNIQMTSYMLIHHGLPIVYTPLTLVAHMVVSVLLLTCSYHLYLMVSRTSSIQHWVKGVELSLAETRMDKESQTQAY